MSIKYWKPEEMQAKLPVLKKRLQIVSAIRKYFTDDGFLEVETPILQISPGLEVHLKAFRADIKEFYETGKSEIYLHTSPEFAMKKLLVAGLPKIFQMARVFRNEERAKIHHPEFVMLEWYRAGEDYKAIMKDCENLIRACLDAVGAEFMEYEGVKCFPFKEWEYLSVAEAFNKYTGIDILNTIEGDLSNPLPEKLAEKAEKTGIKTSKDDRWEDIYFKIFMEKIEPFLGKEIPLVLYDYPVCMAALSRVKQSDKRVAERFELYICGMEIANAFSELTDVKEQEERFKFDMDMKQELYGEHYPIDVDFLAALEYGMPESAGIALGIDRLVMLATNAEKIEDVLWLPVAEQKL